MFRLLSEINASTKLFALIGSPVRHSFSPFIHNTAFAQLHLNCRYVAFDVPPDHLAQAVSGMRALGIGGFNVTVPHKESVMAYLDGISEEARAIQSVNTVVNHDGRWVGYNTDAEGFTQSWKSYGGIEEGQKILILGAGGGARAVVYALIKNFNAREIIIANRSEDRAQKLIRNFEKQFPSVHFSFAAPDITDVDAKVVVNASSVGLQSLQSPVEKPFLQPHMIAYDLIYNPSETLFLKYAREAGAQCVNGVEMLIRQASASFEIWTQKQMPADDILAKLTEILSEKN
jgi:shikimate dehydrogenase